jgi:hypothetical protein
MTTHVKKRCHPKVVEVLGDTKQTLQQIKVYTVIKEIFAFDTERERVAPENQ